MLNEPEQIVAELVLDGNTSTEVPFNFDLERTKKAMEGPFYRVPSGLTAEELGEWTIKKAKEIAEGKEDEQHS